MVLCCNNLKYIDITITIAFVVQSSNGQYQCQLNVFTSLISVSARGPCSGVLEPNILELHDMYRYPI